MKDIIIALILVAGACCWLRSCTQCAVLRWTPPVGEPVLVHRVEPARIEITDAQGGRHTVLERDFGFHDSELVRTVEGHELVFLSRAGCEQFVHVRPCRKCFEAAFAEKMAELERQAEEKERKEAR